MFYLQTKKLANNSARAKWNSGYPTTQKSHIGLTTASFYTQPRKKENNQHIVSFHSVKVNIYEHKQIFHEITPVFCFIKDICRWLQLVFSCSFLYKQLEWLIAVTDITLPQEIQLHPSAIMKEKNVKTYKRICYVISFASSRFNCRRVERWAIQ